ncbi:Kiwa anti-phage protein KwaB-like domain-containing protein [Bradyrhizobium sp. USDA 3256]
MVNLFALTSEPARRIVRIPVSAEVQQEVASTFDDQETKFWETGGEQIAFDGKYKPDEGECLFIEDYDDIDGLHSAVANPLSIPEIEAQGTEFEAVKALFVGRSDPKLVLIQSFDKRKIISNRGLSLFLSSNVFKKVEGVGLTLGTSLAAVLKEKRLSFFSFHSARQMFDLTQYFKEATDEDLRVFAESELLKIEDSSTFIASSDNWIRRKVALVMQSGILDRLEPDATKEAAKHFGIDVQTEVNGEKIKLILPSNKAELKKILRFLDEDYFRSILSSTPHLSNSKRRV